MSRTVALRLGGVRFGSSARAMVLVPGLLLLAVLAAGCGAVTGPPPTPVVVVVTAAPPSPIVIVVTATPAPQAAAPTPAAKPAAAATPAPSPTVAAQAKPTGPVPTPTMAPLALKLGRTNAYRGLTVTVEEAKSDTKIDNVTARGREVIVAVRVKLQNSSPAQVHFAGGPFTSLVRLKLADGTLAKAEETDPLARPILKPEDAVSGWLYFRIEKPEPLEPMALAMGSAQETVVSIPFSGPEPKIAVRTFEYLRTTEIVEGMYWSVSGGELRLDIPGQQANPGQEFIVVKLRATNPTTEPKTMGGRGSVPLEGPQYLRIRADNGVLLQVSGELIKMPTSFPGKAEQDTLYAWQLPLNSKNPKLVILSPDGAEHELELGPLPPG